MGKYPESRLNEWYSNWHWNKHEQYPDCHLIDIDRLWVECKSGNPLLIVDLKEPDAKITWLQEKVYTFFEDHCNLPTYIVYPIFIDFDKKMLKEIHVKRWKTKMVKSFTESQYWIFLSDYKQDMINETEWNIDRGFFDQDWMVK